MRRVSKHCLLPQVVIESDTHMENTLTTFLEVQAKSQAVKCRVIHAQECIQVTMHRDDREIPLDPSVSAATSSSTSKKGTDDQSRRKKV